ncbi:S1C family serine protease [Oceanobacillus chungangensis]|uniref:Serine protease n=1 Tax=Oceanobacillus chungangensis TaxID=1229152 RepID=A0A3D8PII2_9BACI|nr:trypsin-like peptidase domain-containing protein [Oceanobacillus chungangensis]RDW15051.1 serine protease [Oceanobacillus chungangensis]
MENNNNNKDSQSQRPLEDIRESEARNNPPVDSGYHENNQDNWSEPTETDQLQSNQQWIEDESSSEIPKEDVSYQEPIQPTANKKTKEKKTWVSALFGGVVGGLISAIIIVLLFTNNIIPNGNGNDSNQSAENDGSPEVVETLASEDADVSTNIEEVSNAVVGVSNMQQQSIWTESEEAGTGSGIIYKKENGKAYIVTNHHVVDGAQQVEVVLNDDEKLDAKVLGGDSLTDLAVLEVDGATIDTVANIGSSDDLKVGETVLAIGNPLGIDFANSVTKGIISGLNRSVSVDTNGDSQPDWVTEVLQTDAAINPGNSGGALVNSNGEVIGINSMKIAESAVEGIGFAIPIDSALPIIEQLETNSEVARPQIGIATASLSQVPPQYRYEISLPENVEGGMVIANVQTGSPADEAGLQQFDVITKINGQEVTSILELRKYLYTETSIGDSIDIEYIRNGKIQNTTLVLQEAVQQEAA